MSQRENGAGEGRETDWGAKLWGTFRPSDLWNHHWSQSAEYANRTQTAPYPLTPLLPHPCASQPPICLLSLQICLHFLEYCIMELYTLYNFFFWVRLLLLCVIILRIIHVVLGLISSISFVVDWYSIAWIDYHLLRGIWVILSSDYYKKSALNTHV